MKNKKGFTLLELILCIMALSICLLLFHSIFLPEYKIQEKQQVQEQKQEERQEL